MNYYTADQHFGHKNILKYCQRPFPDTDSMDNTMINNWNRIVTDEDKVYVDGDLFFFGKTNIIEVIRNLKGIKYLVIGNHDYNWLKKNRQEAEKLFVSITGDLSVKDGEASIYMCHFPDMTWNAENDNSYMVYGHIHNNTHDTYFPELIKKKNVLNAGVDINHFEPVTLEQMKKNNAEFLASLCM